MMSSIILGILQTSPIVFIEMVSCDIFFDCFLTKKVRWKLWQTGIFYLSLCSVVLLFVKTLRNFLGLKFLAIICVLTFFMIRRYQAKIGKCILIATGYLGLLTAADIVLVVLSENLFVWRWSGSYYGEVYATLITIISKSIEFLLFSWLHRKFGKNKSFYALNESAWRRFMLYSIFTCAALVILWLERVYAEKTALVLAFGLMILNVLFYFTLWDVSKKEKENRDIQLMQEKTNNQLKLYQSMRDSYTEQRTKAHDFKNHIECIRGLLEQGKIEEAKSYVVHITNDIKEGDSPVKTGNTIIDVIVSQKYREAQKAQITFVMKLDTLEKLNMADEDIVILFSNLLDNAIEASYKIEDPKERIIKVIMVQKDKRYFLQVSNRTAGRVVIEDQLVRTTKNNREEHGIGMQNIRSIIQKYNVEGNCKYADGWFTYSILL